MARPRMAWAEARRFLAATVGPCSSRTAKRERNLDWTSPTDHTRSANPSTSASASAPRMSRSTLAAAPRKRLPRPSMSLESHPNFAVSSVMACLTTASLCRSSKMVHTQGILSRLDLRPPPSRSTSGPNLPAPNIDKVVTQNWDLYPGRLTETIQVVGTGPLVGVPYLYSNGVALAPTYYSQVGYNAIEVRYKIPAGAIVGAKAKIIMKTNANDQFEYNVRLFEVKQRPN